MTSTVKVTAHCSKDKEVRITRGDQIVTIQDGETWDGSIYDGIGVYAKEVLKESAPSEAEQDA